MVIDVNIVTAWFAAAATILTPAGYLVARISKLIRRLETLESWTRKQQHDIESSQEGRSILITGTLACLKGLQEQGCNGAVTKSINEIEAYLVREAHKGKSARCA